MVVGSVEDHHLAVVADQPDVVGHLPLSAVEGEDAVGRDQFDTHGSDLDHGTEHFAALHLVERLLDVLQ
jgi:hypothetical protein